MMTCCLCNETIPAAAIGVELEHMMKEHGAETEEQARQMVELYCRTLTSPGE